MNKYIHFKKAERKRESQVKEEDLENLFMFLCVLC